VGLAVSEEDHGLTVDRENNVFEIDDEGARLLFQHVPKDIDVFPP